MVEAKYFIELDPRKDKFESSKPKEKGNADGDGNDNIGNGKNVGNERPHNEKWKPNNRQKRPMKYFLCDGLHMVRDCPKKFLFFAIKRDDEPDRASMRLGLIVCSKKLNQDC